MTRQCSQEMELLSGIHLLWSIRKWWGPNEVTPDSSLDAKSKGNTEAGEQQGALLRAFEGIETTWLSASYY